MTTQPIEEPDDPAQLEQILIMMDADRTVMFSSDYPHWDNDNPRLLFRRLDRRMRAAIMAGTAAELYGLRQPPPPAAVAAARHRNRSTAEDAAAPLAPDQAE